MNGLSAMQFDSFFELYTNTRTRGHSLKFKKKSFHTERRQHFFYGRIINLWNSLDQETVTASSLNSFKNNLVRVQKHEDRSLIGQVIRLWTYKAKPAPPGKASSDKLSGKLPTTVTAINISKLSKYKSISRDFNTDSSFKAKARTKDWT